MNYKCSVGAINHFGLSVADLDESIEFYIEILGLELSLKRELDAFFNLPNNTVFALLQFPGGKEAFDKDMRPHKKGKAFTHYGFSASSMQAVFDFQNHLLKHKIEISKRAYERWDGGSIYFIDPNGYTLEYLFIAHNS